jgi:protein TonB
MFNNLIESTSHVKEFKRRGSFVLLTTITYGVMLVIGGIASVYAYDAHLDSQSTELEITLVPIVTEMAQPEPPKSIARPAPNSGAHTPTESIRTVLMDSTSNPNNPPKTVGTTAPDVPPALPTSKLGSFNSDPEGPALSSNRGVPGGTGNTPAVDIETPPPPPAPKPEPPKVLKVSTGVLQSKIVSIPRPNYPPIAKQMHLQGSISVQVLIDEDGKVISAKALPGGHQLLVNESEKAATQARFTPTLLSGQPVKVSGVIIYNFVLP